MMIQDDEVILIYIKNLTKNLEKREIIKFHKNKNEEIYRKEKSRFYFNSVYFFFVT